MSGAAYVNFWCGHAICLGPTAGRYCRVRALEAGYTAAEIDVAIAAAEDRGRIAELTTAEKARSRERATELRIQQLRAVRPWLVEGAHVRVLEPNVYHDPRTGRRVVHGEGVWRVRRFGYEDHVQLENDGWCYTTTIENLSPTDAPISPPAPRVPLPKERS